MVKLLRELLYNFFIENKSKKLPGIDLGQMNIIDNETFESYCENIVRKMGEDARDISIIVLPWILQIKIVTAILDTTSKALVLIRVNSIVKQCIYRRI